MRTIEASTGDCRHPDASCGTSRARLVTFCDIPRFRSSTMSRSSSGSDTESEPDVVASIWEAAEFATQPAWVGVEPLSPTQTAASVRRAIQHLLNATEDTGIDVCERPSDSLALIT